MSSAVLFTHRLSPRQMLYRVMAWASGIACGLHLGFLVVLSWAGIYGLAWINVASVLFYALATVNIQRQSRLSLWLYLIMLEALGHGVLASCWIGLGTGFYYYMILVPPALLLADIQPLARRWALILGAIMIVLGNSLWRGQQAPWTPLAPGLVLALNVLNLMGTLAIIMFAALFYFRLVNRAHEQLGAIAATDPLTGLLNRRSLIAQWMHALETQSCVLNGIGVLLCDIDRFKDINDRFGHETGDRVLREIGERLKTGVRAHDHLARWGGEEFLVLMPGLDLATAADVAETLRARTADRPVTAAGADLRVTLTVGVTRQEAGESVDQTISRADAALYRGKELGRNCVQCLAPGTADAVEYY
ncbi:GGDEF domain-containing protein [Salinisphaera sp. LB1]|uniref:GGDEF domain-containing protein n=1 Tax=Salinisphaera sp. LB1 TaxID=2183911 RepID=UPI001314CEF2|nr:GGDEF domain-containing protein [Salinisphaera sp. LB1]